MAENAWSPGWANAIVPDRFKAKTEKKIRFIICRSIALARRGNHARPPMGQCLASPQDESTAKMRQDGCGMGRLERVFQ